jgi:hypothetical protein
LVCYSTMILVRLQCSAIASAPDAWTTARFKSQLDEYDMVSCLNVVLARWQGVAEGVAQFLLSLANGQHRCLRMELWD